VINKEDFGEVFEVELGQMETHPALTKPKRLSSIESWVLSKI
jgi:hypothetical protein